MVSDLALDRTWESSICVSLLPMPASGRHHRLTREDTERGAGIGSQQRWKKDEWGERIRVVPRNGNASERMAEHQYKRHPDADDHSPAEGLTGMEKAAEHASREDESCGRAVDISP